MSEEENLLLGRRGELLREILKSRYNIKEADNQRNGRLLAENQAYLSVAELELTKVDIDIENLKGRQRA